MAAEAAILLRDVQGKKGGRMAGLLKSSSKSVRHGELLLPPPRIIVIPRKDGKLAHNYQLASDPSVTLYGSEDDVASLSEDEFRLLVGIKSREARYEVFQNEMLDWGSKLKLETYVYVCLLYTSPSPRDATLSRMPSSA